MSRLDRLAGVLGERRAAIFARHDLRKHEFDVLAALRRAGEPFELTAGELAARTYVTSGTMTSRLDGLTERGLVTRAADRVDGRLVRVALTAAGRALVDAAFQELLDAERDLLTPLAADSLAPLAESLRVAARQGDHPMTGPTTSSVWDAADRPGRRRRPCCRPRPARPPTSPPAGTVAPGLMTHAWLFTGPAGLGPLGRRAGLRRRAASASAPGGWAAASARPAAPCWPAPTPTSTPSCPQGLSIGVDEMRAVVGRAARRPSLGRWQIVVIEDADRLTEQASNALLKAVEEPPPRTVFLLCAPSLHPDDVSLTIRSRCRLVVLRTPPAEAVAGVLRATGYRPGDGRVGGRGRAGARRPLAPAGPRRRRPRPPGRGAGHPGVADLAAGLPGRRRPPRAGGRGRGRGAVGRPRRRRDRVAAGRAGRRRHRPRASRPRSAARPGPCAISRSGRSRGPPAPSATRSTARSSTSPRSTATSCCRWPARRSPPAHPDLADDVVAVAARVGPTGALQRLDAILACREALELNVKPRIAVEALTAALPALTRPDDRVCAGTARSRRREPSSRDTNLIGSGLPCPAWG